MFVHVYVCVNVCVSIYNIHCIHIVNISMVIILIQLLKILLLIAAEINLYRLYIII